MYLDLWRRGHWRCAANSVITPCTHPQGLNRNIKILHHRRRSSFSLFTIMHSNEEICTLIHLQDEGRLSPRSRHKGRLNVNQNVRLWEMAAHHVSIYRDKLTGVFAPKHKTSMHSLHPKRTNVCSCIPTPSIGWEKGRSSCIKSEDKEK